jgi:hypothetical protein
VNFTAGLVSLAASTGSGVGGADTITATTATTWFSVAPWATWSPATAGNDIVLGDEGRVTTGGRRLRRVASEQERHRRLRHAARQRRRRRPGRRRLRRPPSTAAPAATWCSATTWSWTAPSATASPTRGTARWQAPPDLQHGRDRHRGRVLVTAPRASSRVARRCGRLRHPAADHDKGDRKHGGKSNFGDDYIAGGAGNDQIFGQLGNDVIQGDGSIDLTVGATRCADGTLSVTGLGREPRHRRRRLHRRQRRQRRHLRQPGPGRHHRRQLQPVQPDHRRPPHRRRRQGPAVRRRRHRHPRLDAGDTLTSGHANDADVILGDNGNIYRWSAPTASRGRRTSIQLRPDLGLREPRRQAHRGARRRTAGLHARWHRRQRFGRDRHRRRRRDPRRVGRRLHLRHEGRRRPVRRRPGRRHRRRLWQRLDLRRQRPGRRARRRRPHLHQPQRHGGCAQRRGHGHGAVGLSARRAACSRPTSTSPAS